MFGRMVSWGLQFGELSAFYGGLAKQRGLFCSPESRIVFKARNIQLPTRTWNMWHSIMLVIRKLRNFLHDIQTYRSYTACTVGESLMSDDHLDSLQSGSVQAH